MRVSRLLLLGSVLASPAAAQGREQTPAEQVAHVLSRLTFGARPGDSERVARMGVNRWIAEQLRPWTIGDAAVASSLRSISAWTQPTASLAALPDRRMLTSVRLQRPRMAGDSGVNAAMAATAIRTLRVRLVGMLNLNTQFAAGKMVLAEHSERQLFEVVADFWENHFSVYSAKIPSREALVALHRDAVRPYAMGRFRDLLGAVAHSPAMLFYLDNHLSTRDGLNENYARELLELHTLGVDGGYTQPDIIAVARALTGWGINNEKPRPALNEPTRFEFRGGQHDRSEKVVLGTTLAADRGIEDGEEVLDILARHPSTAKFIAWKLVRRLVSDEPPPALVERAAETFRRTDGHIASVVETIVTSDEFFSQAAFRAKVKTPFEFIASARRAFGLDADTTTATVQAVTRLGQPTYGRAEPDGWPDEAASWMNSGTLLNRVMLAADIAAAKAPFADVEYWRGWKNLRGLSAEAQADAVIGAFLGGVASAPTRAALLQANGSGEERLAEMVAVVLGAPEFQRR